MTEIRLKKSDASGDAEEEGEGDDIKDDYLDALMPTHPKNSASGMVTRRNGTGDFLSSMDQMAKRRRHSLSPGLEVELSFFSIFPFSNSILLNNFIY